jgi:mercuric ion binding protein
LLVIGFGIFLGLLGISTSALAGSKTVTLSVPGMYCDMCPVTVKKAIQKVEGVEKVSATYQPKQAVVTFDDSRASVDKLLEATSKAGYPSTLK